MIKVIKRKRSINESKTVRSWKELFEDDAAAPVADQNQQAAPAADANQLQQPAQLTAQQPALQLQPALLPAQQPAQQLQQPTQLPAQQLQQGNQLAPLVTADGISKAIKTYSTGIANNVYNLCNEAAITKNLPFIAAINKALDGPLKDLKASADAIMQAAKSVVIDPKVPKDDDCTNALEMLSKVFDAITEFSKVAQEKLAAPAANGQQLQQPAQQLQQPAQQ